MSERRVVITGLGPVTPIGIGVEAVWGSVREGRSGIRRITHFDPSPFRSQIAGEVTGFDATAYMDARRAKRLDRYSQFAVAAAHLAVRDAGLKLEAMDRERMGVCIGSALGGVAFARH